MTKVEVVFIPSPGLGHLTSTLEFAKLLINRDNRLSITVLVIKFPNTGETIKTISSSFDSENLRVINLPDSAHVSSTSDVGNSVNILIETQKSNVKEVVSNITGKGKLAVFVVDMFCTTMIDVANEFGVPSLVYFTSSVAFLGLILHLHTLLEDNTEALRLSLKRDELDIPCFANPVPTNTLPTVVLRKEWESSFFNYGGGLKKASGFIVNSFHELEPHAINSFLEDPGLRGLPVYPVGPVLNLETKSKETVDSDNIIKWLDDQPPSSVVFLCFGSVGAFDKDQVREIACAIEKCGTRFLWSLRKPPPKGTMGPASDYPLSDLTAVLPEGFLDRTAEIGKVIGWAPQVQVLAHPATGGFVSHCGWNSTLESIYHGVPIATWPLFADQQTNALELVSELKMGVEIALDYRMEYDVGRDYLLTADKIERGIRNVLDKNGEVRKKVKDISEQSRKTSLEGGSSYTCLGRLIDYIVNQV
jgi:hypothetical protein